MRGLKGKTAIVTGAGSGIGRATALAFAATGARVAACDVDPARLAALAAELGPRALCVRQVDVADRAAVARFADEVHAAVGAADVVVNNAGVAVGGELLTTDLDDVDWLIGVNLRGVIHGCRLFGPAMAARGAGQIINVSSVFGIYPAPHAAAYVATKFAVLGLSQALRVELAPRGVGVTAICPGLIATSILADSRLAGSAVGRRGKLLALFQRGLPPARVADAIVDAARTNPAVRTVGKDAWALHQLTRLAPGAARQLGALASRLGGAPAAG